MQLDSVRALKSELERFLFRQSLAYPASLHYTAKVSTNYQLYALEECNSLSLSSSHDAFIPSSQGIALGIGRTSFRSDGHCLAIRIQDLNYQYDPVIGKICKDFKAEVDIQYIGRVHKASSYWYRRRSQPLRMGVSIGHIDGTVGTLGCFVTDATESSNPSVLILSNNHVLAKENDANRNDVIIQPSILDNGTSSDCIGRLERFIRLQSTAINHMDCAVARLNEDVPFDSEHRINGLYTAELPTYIGEPVSAFGRTSGLIRGRISAVELNGVKTRYDMGDLDFNNVIQIEGDGSTPFGQPGDSGSLVISESGEALGLIFAVSNAGGSNGKGWTYANPLPEILNALQVNLF